MVFGMRLIGLLAAALLAIGIMGCGKADTTAEVRPQPEPIEHDVANNGEYIKKSSMQTNPCDVLCVPTQLTKIDDDYFIVDCYHNQILTSKDADAPVSEWLQMSDDINKGHSIAGDGVVYLCDDTENNRVLVYVKEADCFYLTQEFEDVGIRPHYVAYSQEDSCFYVLSSMTGEMYVYEREPSTVTVALKEVRTIPELDGIYVRTFSFIDGDIYLPAGNGTIYCVDRKSMKIKNTWQLAPELGGPVQLSYIQGYYYLTVSTDILGFATGANIVRAKVIEDFNSTDYETIRSEFCEDGTPYVITPVDDGYYLALHSEDGTHCMWYFEADEADITGIRKVFE